MLNLAKLRSTNLYKSSQLLYNSSLQLQMRMFCAKPSSSLDSERPRKSKIYKEHQTFSVLNNQKTRDGVNTLKVMNQVEYTKDGGYYNRKQQYEEFITRMMNLYNSSRREQGVNADRIYNGISDNAIKKDTPESALRRMARDRRAKGFKSASFSNYDQHREIEQSAYMTHLIDEVQFLCLPGQFFPPHTMYKTFSHLAQLKYKNTELIPMVRNKIKGMIDGEKEEDLKAKHRYDALFRDKKGRNANYDIYRGFNDSQEFYSHLETLLEWQSEDATITAAENEVNTLKGSEREEAAEILDLMKHILQVGDDIQSLQSEMAQSIEAVRSQYIQMAEAFDQNQFLQLNKYIKYDLIQIQEKLIEAGLLDPYESVGSIALERLSFHERMGRATQIFYDLTKDYYPEMAPKVNHLFSFNDRRNKEQSSSLKILEKQNDFTLKYIGLVLGKLAEMRHTTRRDAVDNDFYNDYFRQKFFGNEDLINPHKKDKDTDHIKLKMHYTRYWNEVTQTFNELLPVIRRKLAEGDNKDLMLLTYGLTAGEITDRSLLRLIQEKTLEYLRTKPDINLPDDQLILGLQGIAQLPFKDDKTEITINYLKPYIEKIDILDLDLNNKLRLAWALCATQNFTVPKLKELVDDLNTMPFENAQNELLYEELEMLKDIYYSVEHLNVNSKEVKFTNDRVRVLAKSSNLIASEYPEAKADMDPFKEKILNGLALSLSELGADTVGNAQNLLSQTRTETSVINKANYPYSPDLLFAYQNKTIALWVNNRSRYHGENSDDYTTRGMHLTGRHRLQEKILRTLNPNDNVICVFLPVEDIVDFDLVNLSANIKTDAVKKLKFLQSGTKNEYIDDLAKLTQWFVKSQDTPNDKSLTKTGDTEAEDVFTSLLLEFFELIQPKNLSMLHINKHSQNNLKYLLLKIKLASDKLDSESIDKYAQTMGHTNFTGLLMNIKNSISNDLSVNIPKADSELDKNWVGARYGVEIPSMKHHPKEAKDLSFELLNRKFMWCDNYYFSYDDWSQKLRDTYNGFNMLVKSPNDLNSNEKYFYQDQFRRTLSGIFPDAKGIRPLYQPHVKDQFKNDFISKLNLEKKDKLDWSSSTIENRDNKAMIAEDLLKERLPLTKDAKMITNLQNIKHTLKKTHKDSEILKFLTGFEFTDDLITAHLDHLSKYVKPKLQNLKLVPRDASSYRSYKQSLDNTKDKYDPFTNFFLERSQNKEYINEILPQKIKNARSAKEKAMYQEVLDNALLTQEFNENSRFNVGVHVPKNYDLKYDLNTLLRDENDYNVDSDLYAEDISDEFYLHKQRCQAETNLIKSKILTKLHYDEPLNEKEVKYLKIWREKINGSMVPSQPTNLTLNKLSKKDSQAFENLPLIDLSDLGDYSLNDMVLELNHFIDPSTIKDLETEIHVETLRSQWGLPKDFIASENRHKEIDLVLGQVEEDAYRHSAMLDKHEIEGLRDMYKTDIDEGIFNREWLKVDLNEFDNLPFNECDDRLDVLERWFEKKEREVKSRIHLPREHMLDQKLYQAKLQEKTHELVLKLFKKPYSEIAEPELKEFVYGLCSRMMLFEKFPSFMPYLVSEIIAHPNINKVDKEQLETYCDMFEIKWREDSNKPLWLSPINTKLSKKVDDSLDDHVVTERLRKATGEAPYVQNLKQKFIDMSN